jgi:hypothetical protein
MDFRNGEGPEWTSIPSARYDSREPKSGGDPLVEEPTELFSRYADSGG